MRNKYVIFVLLIFISSISNILCSGITYQFEGAGRFGDCVVIYCKSKYLSLIHNLPFYYKPFKYSDKLNMHLMEKNYNSLNTKFQHEKLVHSGDEINNEAINTLFVTDLFTALKGNYPCNLLLFTIPNPLWSFFMVDEIYEKIHSNKEFGSAIKALLQPIDKLEKVIFPDGYITVAVHIRKGSGYDFVYPLVSQQLFDRQALIEGNRECDPGVRRLNPHYRDYSFPLKFPPEQYYIDQIKMLSTVLGDVPIYVHLFTDDQSPNRLLETIKVNCNKKNIWFCVSNNESQNIVKEIYDMSQFDCLIRSCSHFPAVAQLMGNHKIIIRPKNYRWYGSALVITETTMMFYDQDINCLEQVPVQTENLNDLSIKARRLLNVY